MKKIRKDTARTLHGEGKIVYAAPNKKNPYAPWICPVQIPTETDFDKFVNAYEYYNCPRELGQYAVFYID